MKEKVKIESGMQAEICTADGKIYSGTISNIEEEPEVVPWIGVPEDWQSRKWEAAVAAMQGLLARREMGVEDIAEHSFRLANALVRKFKEEGDGEVK